MKRFIYHLLLPAMFLSAGCTSESDPLSSPEEPVSLTASMEDETRAVGTQWEVGDKIGVRVQGNKGTQYQNTQYTIKTGGSTGTLDYVSGQKIYFRPNETYSVFAYYPFGGTVNNVNDLTVNTTSQINQKAIDILGCLMSGVPNTQTSLNLRFKHYMARVVVVVKPGENMAFDVLKSVSLCFKSIKVQGKLKSDLSGIEPTGNAIEWSFTKNSNVQVDNNAKTLTYTLIVVPPLAGDSKSLTLESSNAGSKKTCTFSLARAAGTSQTVEVTVADEKLSVKVFSAVGGGQNNVLWNDNSNVNIAL